MEQALNGPVASSSLPGTFSRGRIFIIHDGSQKHYTEIMNWERGDYYQAKEKILEPSDYEVFVFLFFFLSLHREF